MVSFEWPSRQKNLNFQKMAPKDLSSQFNDPRLGQKFARDGGDPVLLYQCWEDRGIVNFRCELCEVTVFGKKNLDAHIEGKRHVTNLETITLVGESISFISVKICLADVFMAKT